MDASGVCTVHPCAEGLRPHRCSSLLYGGMYGADDLQEGFYFISHSLRDVSLSNPKCFGGIFSFMEFQNAKHSRQNRSLLLMAFYCEIWGIDLN